MSTFDPVISPWLAACSCVGFTFLFVGSLYIFPVKSKLPKKRARHILLASLSQSPPVSASPSALAVTAAAAAAASSHIVEETPPSSPRASSSSFSSVTFSNTGATTTTTNNSTTTTMATTTSMTTSAIIMTKSPSMADNRAHRSSTHLQLIDTTSTQSGSGSTGSLVILSSSSTSASTSASMSTTTTTTLPNASSAALSSSSISSFLISESSTTARPEVATHPHSSSISYDSFQTRHQRSSPPPSSSIHSPVDNQKMDRDHPLVIMQRFKGISFPESIFLLANHIVVPLVLVSVLFMGPILMMFLSNELPFQQTYDWGIQMRYVGGLTGMRNLVVGPISEEFIFRSCMVAVVAYSGAPSYAIIFGLPLVFGIAHIHHGYEAYLKRGATRRALLNATVLSLFQFAYTTIFGWFTTFLFLRTSNLIGPCLCHTFCSIMGAPDVTNIQYFGRWKNWLYLAFATGAVLFGVLLRPLTSPELYGSEASSAYWAITMGSSSSNSTSNI
ncbi:hypothetical protein BGX21_000418 [Mortierella sp. AD011]|nr:hypothetical protein BGX20_010285 [Mortierella sp. AD010]KAF9401840.1 hypothetical protein BGX21_000418 [Mortierella sp. AD011]